MKPSKRSLSCDRWGVFRILLALLPAVPLAAQSPAANGLPPLLREVSFDPQLEAAVPLDAAFRDETGRTVRLGDSFAGKPVILAPVYYGCPMLCNQVLEGIAGSLRAVSFDAGKQFSVVAFSFNPQETPSLAAAKKQEIVDRYHRAGTEAGWHFLTGDESSIARLTRAIGFRYAYDHQTQLYAHASGILILTPQGKISRYFHGIEYAPRDVRFGLIEASANRIGSPMDRVLLFCYQYDPATGKYGALVMRLVRLGSLLAVAGVAVAVLLLRRREQHSASPAPRRTS